MVISDKKKKCIRSTCKTLSNTPEGNGGPLDGSFDSEIIIRLVRTRRNEEMLARHNNNITLIPFATILSSSKSYKY